MEKNIYIAIHTGLEVRNLLRLGTLQRLLQDQKVRVVLATAAYQERSFLREFASERVTVTALRAPRMSRFQSYVLRLYRRWENPLLRAPVLRLQQQLFPSNLYEAVFGQFPPALVVVNPRQPEDIPLALNARRRHVPCLGIVQSWDNILKGLKTRADWLAVWNPINRDEAIQLEHYYPEQIKIVGPLQFDPYFAPDVIRPRDEFLTSLGLDPARPVILFPTSVTWRAGDQTSLLDTLLQASRDGRLVRSPQVVCRPYPRGSLWPYARYLYGTDVYIDVNIDVNPVLGATMNVAQIRHMANLLAHSAVMVNYATTVTLEAAIFDTPTILLAYTNSDDTEKLRNYIEHWHFAKHFHGIVERDLAPVVRNDCQLVNWINRFLADPGLYREQRKQIVSDWVYYVDGRSAERLADWIRRKALLA